MLAPPVIDTRTSLLIPERNKAFSYTPVATGSPTLWEAPGLPAGLAINASTGTISGTPTEAGVLGFVLRASNYESRVAVADAGADTLTSNGHPYVDGDLIDFTTTGTLPAPLAVDTLYEVRDATGSTYKVAAAAGGAAIDLTDTGTGTHTARKKQSDEVSVVMPILDSTSVVTTDDEVSVEIDVDVRTGRVTVLGIEDVIWSPPLATAPESRLRRALMLIQPGERFRALVGFVREGQLLDLEIETLNLLAREYATEASISLNDGVFVKVGSGSTTRYRTVVNVNETAWRSLLSSYEQETGTFHDALGQVRYTLGVDPVLYSETETSTGIAIEGALTGGTKITETLEYRSITEFADVVPAELAVTLAVAGRPLQALSITQDLNLDFATPDWVVTDLTGTATATGATETTKWTATMEVVSVTAVSGGVDVVVEITTTTDTTSTTYVWDVVVAGASDLMLEGSLTFDNPLYFSVWDGTDTQISTSEVMANNYGSPADWLASMEGAWFDMTGSVDVAIEVTGTNSIRITAPSSTSVRKVCLDATDPPTDPLIAPTSSPNPAGTATTAALTGVLSQTADPWVVPFTRISELFVIRAMDSMTVPT